MCNSGGIEVSGDPTEDSSSAKAAEEELLLAQYLLSTCRVVSVENSLVSMSGLDLEHADWTDVITGPFAAPVGILLRSELREKVESVPEEAGTKAPTFQFLSLRLPEDQTSLDQEAYLEESNLKIRKAWEMFLCHKSEVAH